MTHNPIAKCLKQLDATYGEQNYFFRLKARLLLGVNALLIALVFVNLARFIWSQPPGLPLRICVNLIIAAAIVVSIRYTWKGKLASGGSSLALGLALPIHLIVVIVPGEYFVQPVATAFQLFVFDTFLLLFTLIFASKRNALIAFSVIFLGNAIFYFKTLAVGPVPGSLRFTADILARDGLLGLVFIFAIGVLLLLMLEVVTKRSDQMLRSVKSMNRLLEQRVAERTKELEEATRKANTATLAKSDFLANMSHEIRTPLFAIIAQTEILKAQEDRFSDHDLKDLNIISESGDLLLHLINDILDFSKIEAQQLKLESSVFALRTLIDECISTVAFIAKKKELPIVFDANKTLDISVLGDSHRLKQIILNLLSNAVKFTPPGGKITVKVELLRCKDESADIHFKISDTGIGMDEATRQNIFNRFTQAESSTTRQFGGTGLGLAISSQLVAMMGGELTAHSQPDSGSSFEFALTLPVKQTEVAKKSPKSREFDSLGMHILIVEDNQANQFIIGRQLETLGCSHEIANNGAEALEILKSNPDIQLVLMDQNMPVMDGPLATKKIRAWKDDDGADPAQKRAADLPIIVFTANTISADQFAENYPQMTDCLIKPIKMQELHDMLVKYRV